jgi:hypothetical protein
MAILISNGLEAQNKAEALFEQTDEPFYEEALAILEDNVFFLTENRKQVLELAFETEKNHENPCADLGQLAVHLIQLNPERDINELEIPVEVLHFNTDTTWWYTIRLQDGWESDQFEMKEWVRPAPGNSSGMFMSGDSLKHGPIKRFQGMITYFARKEIEIPGYPVSGELRFQNNPPTRLFLNGINMKTNDNSDSIPLTSKLKEGKNLLALAWLRDKGLVVDGVATIQYVPRQIKWKKGGP